LWVGCVIRRSAASRTMSLRLPCRRSIARSQAASPRSSVTTGSRLCSDAAQPSSSASWASVASSSSRLSRRGCRVSAPDRKSSPPGRSGRPGICCNGQRGPVWRYAAADGCATANGQGIGPGSQRGRLFDGQRRIADAYFNGAEFRLRPDVPIQILDALAMPQACRKAKCSVNSCQLPSGGHCPLSGKAETALSRADWKEAVDAIDKGGGGGERDEGRHINAERLGQPDGVVGRGAADMDVLAENGELLGEITIALVKVVEAVAGTDAPFRPMMERVRAATADADVVALAMLAQGVAQARRGRRQCRRRWPAAGC
jgi:hypothetical protein